RIELNELIVDRPVLHLRIDAQGRSNLPVSPHPSNANSTNELFNLEVGDCAIRSGEIFYNNDETPLDAELHHLQFTARYRVLTSEYQGSLSYSEGSLAARDLGPIDNAMQVHFTASRSGISLSPLLLMTRASRIAVNAQLTNYQHPSIVASYDGSISTEAIAQVVRSQSVPVGIVTLNGKVAYQSAQSRPFIASVNANGKIRSADLQLRTGERPVSVSAVRATYNLANGNLSVQNVAANILGGTLHANWGIQHLDTTLHTSRINAILNGVSLKTLSDTLAPKNVQRIPFVGETNLNVNALWTGSIKNAVAHARLAISSRQSANPSHVIRVNGLVQVTYSGPQNTASFGQSYLRTLKTQVSISGTLSPKRAGRSALDIVANTSDLGEAGELAAIIQNAMTPSRKPPQIPALGGAAALTVHATGSLKAPHINGRITAQNLIVDSTRWHSLAVNINGSPSGVSVGNGVLTQAGNTQVKFAGSIGLRNWSPQASSAIQVHAAVKNLQLQMAEEITKLHYPIAGAASANLSVSGTKAAPRGKLELTILNASAWDQPVQKLTVNAQAETNVIQATMNLQIPAGNISARGSYSLSTEQYTAGLRGNGIKLQQISALEDRYPAKGTFDISASGHGPIRNSQIEAALTIPELQIRNQKITNISARLNVADKRAHVQFQAVADQGSVQATGNVALTGEYTATAQLDIYKLPIAAVAAKVLRGDSAPIGGQAEIHLKLSGPLKSPAQMQAQLEIPTLSVSYAKAQLALGRTLQADYRNGTLTINPTAIRGTGTNLTFGGTIPIKSEAAYSLAANGSVDMSVLQQFAPTVKSSGQIDLHIRSTGKLANPSMQGQLEIKNAVFTTETSPVGIEGVNALINLSGRRADIADFSGTVGGGTVSARGFAIFGPKGSFDVVLNASGIRMLYPQGLRSDLSAQITFAGDTASSTLSGRVLVNHLSFTQQFDLASLTGDFSEESGSGTPSPFENSVKLNVAVQSSEPINLANRQLSFAGSANLNVIGTLANPVILGRIAVTGGDVFFLSKRFQFQNGTIAFANPARTEPVLSMYITTTVEQYNVTLNLSGPVDRLKVNYTSDPALAPADIIHLLAFGNTTAEAAAQPSQSAAIGAESVLAQGVGSQVAGKLQNLAGISQITIDPLATNNSGDPGSQIALQERITGSLLFTFSTNVTTTQGQTVELQYQLNPRISITAIRDQNGGYALDLRWHKVF
ncbi:MAG TPA: translocation/assembly module TamB domain-containing protein, partial [Candidatus Acidoferrales bacterium]|nr:translocation/assembly module TamB domain-containing protein [Candidatus Acidoferrales bacterium]